MNMKRPIIALFVSVLVMGSAIGITMYVSDITKSTLEVGSYSWGSKGEEVKKIQTNLKKWGYYDGNVDGTYGQKTWEAVKKFQQKNGLKADGVVGKQTLEKLGIQLKSQQSTSSNADGDRNIYLLSAAIYGEARGEPYVGQVAVGAVILNRVKHASFPNTIAGVVYQPGAFDAVTDGQINLNPDETAKKAARDALNGWDPTNGAIYYWNPATATSKWIWSVPITSRIGKHVFGKK